MPIISQNKKKNEVIRAVKTEAKDIIAITNPKIRRSAKNQVGRNAKIKRVVVK